MTLWRRQNDPQPFWDSFPHAPLVVRRWLALAAGFAAVVLAAPSAHAIEGEDIFSYAVGGSVSYDNNLLRLPNNVSPSGLVDRPGRQRRLLKEANRRAVGPTTLRQSIAHGRELVER